MKIENSWLVCECGKKIKIVRKDCSAVNLEELCPRCKRTFLINIKDGKIIGQKLLTNEK